MSIRPKKELLATNNTNDASHLSRIYSCKFVQLSAMLLARSWLKYMEFWSIIKVSIISVLFSSSYLFRFWKQSITCVLISDFWLLIFLEFIDRAETSVIYFCARVINHSETPINNKFGIQTPSIGGIKLLKAKVTENLESII